ncbi:MAG: hypothetical protein Q9225_001845 [Loekoesia sp. 1 TL-2023]
MAQIYTDYIVVTKRIFTKGLLSQVKDQDDEQPSYLPGFIIVRLQPLITSASGPTQGSEILSSTLRALYIVDHVLLLPKWLTLVAQAPLVVELNLLTYDKYMAHTMGKYYYDEIKKAGSVESAVDNFWNNILPLYFKRENLYGIEQEQRPLETIYKRANFITRCIRNGVLKKVIILESKNKGVETQSAIWADALTQLVDYAKLVRTEQPNEGILYLMLDLGTYVRFYELPPPDQNARDYKSKKTGKAYELKADEEEIHKILTELVAKTSL